MADVSTLLQVLHFTHFLWNGFLSAAMKDSAGNTDVLHAGHCGDAGGAVHPMAGVQALAVTAVLNTRLLLSFRSDMISYVIDK